MLRHELRDRGTRFSLCQFRPEHDPNPDTLARYAKNRLRIVPELVHSSWATEAELAATGAKAKAWRIDLVLFVNGLPVTTLELKSEFKQAAERAIKQYKTTRLPVDPITKKPEPLLTFKRGALVHFAVSQYEVAMTTLLAGEATVFLPFNRGTEDGGAGNDVPKDVSRYATDYLWNEVLLPDNLLNTLARFVHLEIKDREARDGRKWKQEAMIFPRYHLWDVVRKLLETSRAEGPDQKYLIQHRAGSGKSNSIAWSAHQLSSLAYQQTRDLLERAKKTGDAVLRANAEKNHQDAKKEKDALEIFKKDLGTFVRFYEFMSQIVDYDDAGLEKLSLYARNLVPLLREQLLDENEVDLSNVVLSHYRLSKIKQQDLMLEEEQAPYGLKPGEGLGTARARDKREELLSLNHRATERTLHHRPPHRAGPRQLRQHRARQGAGKREGHEPACQQQRRAGLAGRFPQSDGRRHPQQQRGPREPKDPTPLRSEEDGGLCQAGLRSDQDGGVILPYSAAVGRYSDR